MTLKEVRFGNALMEDRDLLPLVRQSTELLEEIVGSSGPTVSAEWDRGDDATGREVVVLRLSDWTGSVTGVFDPKELLASRLTDRFYLLWLDLLRLRARKQLAELMGAGET